MTETAEIEDLFTEKQIKPMLIGETAEAFDSTDYIFELKLDGERCIAYLDPVEGTELRNKRNMKMLEKAPELSEIHKQVKHRCILDGELVVIVDGKPEFFEIQRRSLTTNRFKIRLQSSKHPASLIAFDILYDIDHEVASLPLMERKRLLKSVVIENEKLAVSRYIEQKGVEFYKLAESLNLEGIVAKKKDSIYFFGKRTKDWIKIKNLQDDDYVVCGYIQKENNVVSVILGQYDEDRLVYKGHVTLGVSSADFSLIDRIKKTARPPFKEVPPGNENAVWLDPELVCKVKYMMKTSLGTLRQPVFAGLRPDKEPRECTLF